MSDGAIKRSEGPEAASSSSSMLGRQVVISLGLQQLADKVFVRADVQNYV